MIRFKPTPTARTILRYCRRLVPRGRLKSSLQPQIFPKSECRRKGTELESERKAHRKF